MTAVKVIKVLGSSEESWERAAENAVEEASKTVENISGVEVEGWTADVEGGAVTNYKATVEITFPVKGSESGE